jgi:uncharacterized protein YndB with AHSA1/START domain
MAEERKTRQHMVVDTTPELAFEALTKASELREWCSDEAWTEVRPGGRFAVRWNSGYRAEGTFAELDPPRHAVVTWQGTGEPGQTTVEFAVETVEDGVAVSIVHSGFGLGSEWDRAVEESHNGWSQGVENLKSTLETGVDLRLARQPFLGVGLDLLDAERAAKEGIAAERGIYITSTVEGSGAEAAGLGKGDVIVALGGAETPGYAELTAALRSHRAGDVVDVGLVRGQERETIQVTLGQRPRPEVPATVDGLAEYVAAQYAESGAELKAALQGVGDDEAGQRPADDEWSVKEVLAHLSIVERDTQSYWASVALDGWLDGGPGNPTAMPARIAAVLVGEPALEHLLARYLADEAEMVAFLRRLPKDTVAHKARFFRMRQGVAFRRFHTRQHIEQIKSTVEAVRSAS